jgi:hypothetical protein
VLGREPARSYSPRGAVACHAQWPNNAAGKRHGAAAGHRRCGGDRRSRRWRPTPAARFRWLAMSATRSYILEEEGRGEAAL